MSHNRQKTLSKLKGLNAHQYHYLAKQQKYLDSHLQQVIDQPVVETKTIPRKLTSLLAFDESKSIRRKHERCAGECDDSRSRYHY